MKLYRTTGGVEVTREVHELRTDEFDALIDQVETRRGGVLSSGMEYPGRYSRWHMAYCDPCIELSCVGRTVKIRALNDRGAVLIPHLRTVASPCGRVTDFDEGFSIAIPVSEAAFTEEERTRRPSVFTALRAILDSLHCDDPHLGFYGAFGYDLAFQFAPVEYAKPRGENDRDLVLHLPDEISIADRKREIAHRFTYEFKVDGVSTRGLTRMTASVPYVPATQVPDPPRPGAYADVVAKARTHFATGDLFEVVPSHRMYAACDSPAAFFRRLRSTNPAPYEFFFNLGEGEHLVGASPEMYVRVNDKRVETCPISGTIARGTDALGDADNILKLLSSEKEKSELTMCTDVDRNDKARVCVPGSVKILGRRQIEMYSRLIHTVDHIEGRLRADMDGLDAFLTHMWAVTVTGAPKTWAMRFIEQHEPAPRRWYGGAVGKVGVDGSVNTGLTLRTAHIRDGVAAVSAGATLLFDSDPEAEERETHLKARALLAVAGGDSPPPPAATGTPDTVVREQRGRQRHVLLIDHEDSFVHTLGDYFQQHGATVTTIRYGVDAATLDRYAPDLVVLSPGPGKPSDFGCHALLDALYDRNLPVFGVCLGMQAMVEHAGGELQQLQTPWHGKASTIARSRDSMLLAGLDSDITVARYHSLYAPTATVAKWFDVTAQTDGVAMAIEDRHGLRFGVQFHPESILSSSGSTGLRIIGNVLHATQTR